MAYGKTNRKCIRCLKCVSECPNNALHFSTRLPMRMYLRKKKCDKLIIYGDN
ncbi:MAG: 4Fe-4S binding protein [Clostridiales bacterium]|nr:4Fe-4S binding protein [Clostridiales bacterium]